MIGGGYRHPVDWSWPQVLGGVAVTVVVLYVALLGALVLLRPRGVAPAELLRVGVDLTRLVSRLARDAALPRSVRWRVWLLLGYLAMPIDLVPDMLPVIGHLDDVVVAALVLRSVVRRAGPELVRSHWSGSPEGLALVLRLAGSRTT